MKELWGKTMEVFTPKARVLFMVSVIWMMVGISYVATASELKPSQPAYQAYYAQFSLVSGLSFWGTLFIISGVIGLITAVMREYWIGFSSLIIMSTWWAGMFFASLIATGYNRIVPQIFVWMIISIFLYTISAWPEFPKHHDEEPPHLEEKEVK